MFQTLKNVIRILLSTALTLFFLACVWLSNVCVLRKIDGERTFYVYASSSQATRTQTLDWSQLFFVSGESVRLTSVPTDGVAFANALADTFRAEILFVEEVGDTLSFYAFSPNLPRGIMLYGEKINLHIAISTRGCVVGSPIIFDGY